MIKKVFTWAPLAISILMVAMVLMSFSMKAEIMDQSEPINKDGAISAGWVLAGLAGTTVALLTTMFLFAWRVIQMQGVTQNKTTTMLNGYDLRMRVLEDVCLPSHINKKGNAAKMAAILKENARKN